MVSMHGLRVMKMNSNYPIAYACKNKNLDIRLNSRSGGVFTEISDYILNKGGRVYGCVKTDDFCAKHIGTSSKEERDKMRGSKYIPSDLGDTYNETARDLKDGIPVLYSALPCQIDGLINFLKLKKIDMSNLYTAEIICHGVPSPAVWKAYLDYQSKRYEAKLTDVNYRNKIDYGWEEHIETLYFGKKKVSSKIFRNIYRSDEILRPSCYCCSYKSIQRTGDITLGDFWGVKEKAPDLDDNKGVSVCLINSDKGKKLFDSSCSNLIMREFDINDVLQDALIKSYPKPFDRPKFWYLFKNKGFDVIAKDYGFDSVISRIWIKLNPKTKAIIKKIF